MNQDKDKDWRNAAEKLFETFDAYNAITREKEGTVRKPGFNELFKYATDPTYEPSTTLTEALSRDFRLNQDLRRLLSKHAIIEIPRAAAASSGDITTREADGFVLKLKTSQAKPDQVYLIIEAVERDEKPQFIFIAQENGPTLRLVIEDFQDGEAQILLEADSAFVKALRNIDAEVTLA